jgi:hypothetical protein
MCLITRYFVMLFIALSYDHKITSQLLVQCLGIYCCWLIHYNADAFSCTLIVSIGNHAVDLLRIYSGVLLQEICCRQTRHSWIIIHINSLLLFCPNWNINWMTSHPTYSVIFRWLSKGNCFFHEFHCEEERTILYRYKVNWVLYLKWVEFCH